MNDMSNQSTILYFDASVEFLTKHSEHGFVHPISGDAITILRANRKAATK